MKFQHTTKIHHPGLWQSAGQTASQQAAVSSVIASEATFNPTNDQHAEVVAACVNGESEKWITIVGGNREFIAELLAAGIPKQRIRWLRTGDHTQREWALEQATLAGTSAVIVGWLDGLEQRFCQRIKMACRLSQTKSFLFEEDALFPHLH